LNEKIAQYPGRDRQSAFQRLPRRSDDEDAPTLWRRRLVFISLHFGKIDAFNADQTRLGFASRRMQISLAIEVCHAGSHFVRSHLCDLPRLSICWLFDKPPIRHLGFTGGLAVDSPARSVIVRSANLGPLIDVAEYAEMKVGILVKNLAFRVRVGAEVLADKVLIGARLLGKLADALATGGAGIPSEARPGNRQQIDLACRP